MIMGKKITCVNIEYDLILGHFCDTNYSRFSRFDKKSIKFSDASHGHMAITWPGCETGVDSAQ